MIHFSKRVAVVNTIGVFFYLTCLFQWAWSALPYMPGIIQFLDMFQSKPDQPVSHVNAPSLISSAPTPLVWIIGTLITIAILSLTIYILIKLPISIAKSGQKLTQKTTSYILPAVSRHVKLTPKKRQRLTARIIIDIKIALSVLPVILGLCVYFLPESALGYELTAFIVAVLGISSLCLLSLQVVMIRWLKPAPHAIW